jgi:spoIIIJ-associated protein
MNETKLQQGTQWLEELLRLAGLPKGVTANFSEADGSCWLTIASDALTPEQVEQLIGPEGNVIDSVQYLINTILNLGVSDSERRAYTVELAGYRAQRQLELQEMAQRAAEHVQETGEEYEMKALSSAERRQIHTFLKSFADLETYSRGQEPDRRLVIRRLQA